MSCDAAYTEGPGSAVGPEVVTWKFQAESDSEKINSAATNHRGRALGGGSSRRLVLKSKHVSEGTSLLPWPNPRKSDATRQG